MISCIKAVFLDRDGVLNVDTGYLHRIEDLVWVQGARDAVAYLCNTGWTVFVVTNQSGVARGYYTEDDVQVLHQAMNEKLKETGGRIEEFFYCPYLKGAAIPEYDQDSEDRKPQPGMIVKALKKYHISPERAVLFGDSIKDVEAAQRAGIQGFLFDGTDLNDFIQQHLPQLGD